MSKQEITLEEFRKQRESWPKCQQCSNPIHPAEFKAGWTLCEQCEPIPQGLAELVNGAKEEARGNEA